MKSKQLANVLIKILGLSVLIHGIPSIISGIFPMLQIIGPRSPAGDAWLLSLIYLLSYAIQVAIGIYFIIKSRDVAAFLFKDEDE